MSDAAPRLKLLVVSPDPEFIHQLNQAEPDQLEILHARRPAETVRRFEAESPDLVIIELSARPEQEALLIHAIHERPLGALVPLFVVDRLGLRAEHPLASLDGAREAGADRFFPHGTPASAIVVAAAELLNIPLQLAAPSYTSISHAPPAPAPPPPSEPWRPPIQRSTLRTPAVPLPHPSTSAAAIPAWSPPLSGAHTAAGLSSQHLHAYSGSSATFPAVEGEVTPEQLRRKLRQARHEDYFTLLELRKSADHTQIEQAWRALRGRFEPARLPRAIADRHYQELAELCDALDDAFGVLGDEELRKVYLSSLLRHEV